MNKSDLEKVLNGDIELIEKLDVTEVAYPEDDIQVFPRYLKPMLLNYLNDSISADDLNHWATFLMLRAEYISPGDPFNDEQMDYYEAMWNVINWLSTPEIDGEITKERVKGYLSELQKYQDE